MMMQKIRGATWIIVIILLHIVVISLAVDDVRYIMMPGGAHNKRRAEGRDLDATYYELIDRGYEKKDTDDMSVAVDATRVLKGQSQSTTTRQLQRNKKKKNKEIE